MIPREKHHPEWHTPVPVPNRRVFAVLCICSHCLMRIAPNSLWRRRVKDLVAQSPDSPLLNMGIPGRWLESPLWKGDVNGG